MARTQRPQKPTKKAHTPSRNATGYAKRLAAKGKRPSKADIDDVYEYQPEKVRRGKVKLEYEREELAGARRDDSDEDNEDGAGHLKKGAKPRLIGEGEDDERIGEDEDEDIDSDEAFDESDDERFAGFGFLQKKKPKAKPKNSNPARTSRDVRFAEVDLDEGDDEAGPSFTQEDASGASGSDGAQGSDSDEEEEGDPAEFIDVLDVLDGRGEPESGDDKDDGQQGTVNSQRQKASTAIDNATRVGQSEDEEMEEADNEEDDEDEDEEDEGVDEGQISASENEDEGDVSALDHLERFVTNLDAGQKRKSPEPEAGVEAPKAKKRRLLPEQTEAGEENEFAAHVGSGAKLRIDDLLAPLVGQSSNLQSLKKSAKILTSQSGRSKTLAAPLPQRTAERLDREAAYEQTKEEVDKWKATMQRIKEAEHLSFPLQAEPAGKTSSLELAAKFKPTTELESAVDRLLKSAKMRDEDIVQTESLKMNHLSVEEVKARRAELAKMRELMFRAEAKAKRVAKIKSKTYRRLKKKERAKLAKQLGEGESDVDEDDEEARLKREMERAVERATLRHKNTGKWAKAMKSRGELDVDQRKEISEMLDRGQKLRKKIQGKDSDEDSDEDSDDDEVTTQRVKESAFEELAGLEDGAADAPAEGGTQGKSIFEMKFMKDAMTRQQYRVNEEIDDFVKEMGGQPIDPDDEGQDIAVEEGEQAYGASVQRVGSRVTYRPGPPGVDSLRPTGSLASDTSSVTLKSTDFPGPSQPTSPASARIMFPLSQDRTTLPPAEASNPWLARTGDADRPIQKKQELAVGKNSAAAEKSKNKLRKRKQKREEEKEKEKEDAAVDVSMSNVMTLGSGSAASAGPSKKKAASAPKPAQPSGPRPTGDDDGSDSNSEVDDQEKLLADPKGKGKGKANGVKAFQQRDLVARAFAGDNVVQEFAEAKQREVQEDAPREIDTTLPGWGAWGGQGARKAPSKPYLIKKVAGVDPTTRADYGKAHVIISEKRDKKAAKYTVRDLPFPYTSRAQFERSLDAPIGIEWNTRVGFQRATLPRVVTKPGQIIAPLEKQHA